MKALSVRQPWAWEIVQGIKVVEFRTWSTNLNESFYVHAPETVDKVYLAGERSWLSRYGIVLPEDLPTGGIVGTAYLEKCVPRVEPTLLRRVYDELFVKRPAPGVAPRPDSKWFKDPYGFILKDARPLPFRRLPGRLKFFEVPDDPYGSEFET